MTEGEQKYRSPRITLWVDAIMGQFIKIGGLGIIASVLAIFFLILWQVLPLFRGAKVQLQTTLPPAPSRLAWLALDEWGLRPYGMDSEGNLWIWDAAKNAPPERKTSLFPSDKKILTSRYEPESQTLVVGTERGEVGIIRLHTSLSSDQENPTVNIEVDPPAFKQINLASEPILAVDFGGSENFQVIATISGEGSSSKVMLQAFRKEENLLGEGTFQALEPQALTLPSGEFPKMVRINQSGDLLLIFSNQGTAHYFQWEENQFVHRQSFRPFQDLNDPTIASADFVFGGVSIYLTNPTGANRVYSLYIPSGEEQRVFGKTKEFPPLPEGSKFFSPSLRNKAFLVGSENRASIRYVTTEAVRWQESFSNPLRLGALTRKYQKMALIDETGQLHLFDINDPYAEAGWKAFFGKIWYEGFSEPTYSWQSTGGSDSFEPKLSLIPLIFGTLKGTFYAMIVATPLALLAALYTSQFLHPRYRQIVKPVMEIMASLPSVILGFIAALWLAPRIETKTPSLLLMSCALPASAMLWGLLWARLPNRLRYWLPEGFEIFLMIPVLILVSWSAWNIGPIIERWFFVFTDPQTGQRIADFRLWWPQVTGTSFEQRNSVVVGFMMGFAVIPVIFTIAEDSLSQVSPNLRSAALALGASRWQTAFRVILPTASAGIFSALMIGLGRAVGETMIVLMATGNTPIMQWNPFNGMRTLSANLAVELPEAPFQGTLYRTLFLGALVLFLMTFLANTLAEYLRQHLRERYKSL